MRVLVTGGAGFIGGAVARELVMAGHDVHLLDVLLPEAHPGLAVGGPPVTDGLPLARADLRDAAAVEAVVSSGFDAVFHQAAKVGLGVSLDDLPDYASCNDLATAVLLAAMGRAGTARLVLASSMVVYGEGRYRCDVHGNVRPAARRVADLQAGRFEPPCPTCGLPLVPAEIDERARLDPRNGYAASKVAQEHLAAAWAIATGGRAVALRYHNVYGPGLPRNTPYAGVAAIFRSALEAGAAPRVFEDGLQRRDFVEVRDVARANLAALAALDEHPAGAVTAYNIASGRPRTIADLAAALAAALGGPSPQVTGEFRVGDVRHIVASARLARERLGFRAQVDFEDGVRSLAGSRLA